MLIDPLTPMLMERKRLWLVLNLRRWMLVGTVTCFNDQIVLCDIFHRIFNIFFNYSLNIVIFVEHFRAGMSQR